LLLPLFTYYSWQSSGRLFTTGPDTHASLLKILWAFKTTLNKNPL
jgi:hypothetical protein